MKRKHLACSVLFCATMLSQSVSADLVAFSYDDWSLYGLNVTTMQTTKIGDLIIPRSADLACMARASDTSAYMVGRAQNILYTVSLVDASTIASVPLDRDIEVNGRGLDLAPDGVLYAVFAGRELRSINPLTGQTSLRVQLDSPIVESITFSPAGTLYAAEYGEYWYGNVATLSTVNVSTGYLNHIMDLGVLDADDMAWLGGYLYAADSQAGVVADLYRIDPATGATVNLGSTGIAELNGLMAVETQAVPLPGASILGSIGLAYAGWRLRRRGVC